MGLATKELTAFLKEVAANLCLLLLERRLQFLDTQITLFRISLKFRRSVPVERSCSSGLSTVTSVAFSPKTPTLVSPQQSSIPKPRLMVSPHCTSAMGPKHTATAWRQHTSFSMT